MKMDFKPIGNIGSPCAINSEGVVVSFETGDVRRPTITGTGMRYHSFYDIVTGKQENRFIHYMLAEAFLGYSKYDRPRRFVTVPSGDYMNCTLKDIEITDKRPRRTFRKLDTSYRDARRDVIINKHRAGMTYQEIANEYKVSRSLICRIIGGDR